MRQNVRLVYSKSKGAAGTVFSAVVYPLESKSYPHGEKILRDRLIAGAHCLRCG